MDLNGKKIAILATNGFEQSELETPRDRLKRAGATVDVVSLAGGEIDQSSSPIKSSVDRCAAAAKSASDSALPANHLRVSASQLM